MSSRSNKIATIQIQLRFRQFYLECSSVSCDFHVQRVPSAAQ